MLSLRAFLAFFFLACLTQPQSKNNTKGKGEGSRSNNGSVLACPGSHVFFVFAFPYLGFVFVIAEAGRRRSSMPCPSSLLNEPLTSLHAHTQQNTGTIYSRKSVREAQPLAQHPSKPQLFSSLASLFAPPIIILPHCSPLPSSIPPSLHIDIHEFDGRRVRRLAHHLLAGRSALSSGVCQQGGGEQVREGGRGGRGGREGSEEEGKVSLRKTRVMWRSQALINELV